MEWELVHKRDSSAKLHQPIPWRVGKLSTNPISSHKYTLIDCVPQDGIQHCHTYLGICTSARRYCHHGHGIAYMNLRGGCSANEFPKSIIC
jgi:hypothetical protein